MTQAPNKPLYLQDSLQKQGVLGWWYHLMAYHLPPNQIPTLRDQEIIRRSRLATFVLCVQLLLIEGPVIPVVAAAPNHAIVLPWLLGCIGILLLAFVCNRLGKLTAAGLLMVASIEITVCLKILTVPGGIGVSSLPQFDILIQPVLLAVVLLPPWSAFIVAFLNIGFIAFSLVDGLHAPDLTAALHNPTLVGDIFAVPIMAQFIIATVAYLIVANLLAALKRASRAEQIAQLEHAIAESQRELEWRNRELETGISTVVQAIQSAANNREGTYERISLPSGHPLWPVLQQVWHFLDRYQRSRQAEARLDATMYACTELIQVLEAAQQGQQVRLPPRRNTPVDGIVFALANMQHGRQRPGSVSGSLNQQPYPTQ
jgi:hypothetical protein